LRLLLDILSFYFQFYFSLLFSNDSILLSCPEVFHHLIQLVMFLAFIKEFDHSFIRGLEFIHNCYFEALAHTTLEVPQHMRLKRQYKRTMGNPMSAP
jgi:signal transduction histidine kinase